MRYKKKRNTELEKKWTEGNGQRQTDLMTRPDLICT